MSVGASEGGDASKYPPVPEAPQNARARVTYAKATGRLRRLILSAGLTLVLAGFAWELAYDINDPTIPLVRELLFTAGAILGMTAYFALLARVDE